MIGIYKITSPSGRVYIGQSRNIEKRWREYQNLGRAVQQQNKLMRSFLKYGVENHVFEIVLEISAEEIPKLNELEAYYINKFKCVKIGLNCRCNGYHREMTKEIRNKISRSKIGKPRPDLAIRNKLYPTRLGKFGEKHPTARLVLNLETGIYYHGIREAAESVNLKPSTLQKMLSGINKNRTTMILA